MLTEIMKMMFLCKKTFNRGKNNLRIHRLHLKFNNMYNKITINCLLIFPTKVPLFLAAAI